MVPGASVGTVELSGPVSDVVILGYTTVGDRGIEVEDPGVIGRHGLDGGVRHSRVGADYSCV